MHQQAFVAVHEAAHVRVMGFVHLEALARQILPALGAIQQADEVDADLAAEAFGDHETATPGAAGLVDPGRDGGSAAIVEGGLVQQPEATLELIAQVHPSALSRRARQPSSPLRREVGPEAVPNGRRMSSGPRRRPEPVHSRPGT